MKVSVTQIEKDGQRSSISSCELSYKSVQQWKCWRFNSSERWPSNAQGSFCESSPVHASEMEGLMFFQEMLEFRMKTHMHLPGSVLSGRPLHYLSAHSWSDLPYPCSKAGQSEGGAPLFHSFVNITCGFHRGDPALAVPQSGVGRQNLHGFCPVLNFKIHLASFQGVFNVNELRFLLNIASALEMFKIKFVITEMKHWLW